MSTKYIRLAQLVGSAEHVGRLPVHRNTLWRWVREGKFPPPVKLGENTTAWRLEDVEAWEQSRQEVAA
jgi:prophage regulatory protein